LTPLVDSYLSAPDYGRPEGRLSKPKVLVANRGEIAVRIIRTCREMGIPSVAVYSDADRESLHVEMADSSYRIGPPPAADSYLSIGALLDVARKSRATMVHPGYGFLAERAHFSAAVEQEGLSFIGPGPRAIELMGDKMSARRVADAAGMPITPGTLEPVDHKTAKKVAAEVGYPMLVKAAFGGGGKGMRVVNGDDELDDALEGAAREAQAYFGRPELYLERYIERAHHVEAQVIADKHGNVFFLGERDCSLQRRHQKLVEETPSPLVTPEMRERLRETSMSLVQQAGYVNAGTIETIADESGHFYFMEMNTRLQVEHTVTEMVTGYDIVALQIAVAMGEELDLDPQPRGHAIQCRINAEDPSKDFQPGPGVISRFVEPAGPFVRLDSGVTEGRAISPEYDSMIAKLMVWGSDRDAARHRMMRALSEFKIEGVPSTIPFHQWVMKQPEFVKARHTTTWVEKALAGTPLDGEVTPIPAQLPRRVLANEMLVEVNGRHIPVRLFDDRLEIAPRPPVAAGGSGAGGNVLASPMQGKILKVLVQAGQAVATGDTICILEAMKMENHITSVRDGEVRELPIKVGDHIEVGAVLAVIE
jgi:acetyl-CoA/propionyl-CoA carboxylase biotin carboxyl carrier protein